MTETPAVAAFGRGLAEARLEREPFAWAHVTEVFDPRFARDLADAFPQDDFQRVVREDADKPYEMHVRTVVADGAPTESAASLPAPWRAFLDLVTTDEYRSHLSRLTGEELGEAKLEVNLWRYDGGCWLAPHLDKPEKLVTQVFYFNDNWEPAWGGCLLVLRSHAEDDVTRMVPPVVNTSVVLVRSERSWHAVSRVRGDRADLPARRSAQVVFTRRDDA